jgi:predicted Fe-Mo cluster-binding NifX family protein
MSEHEGVVVCIPVGSDRQVGHSWGKATVVATATVRDGAIVDWAEDTVSWDVLHDEGPHGSHHGRIARFLLEHKAQAVAASHMGPPMANMLAKMGLAVDLGVSGSAEAAVLAAAARVTDPSVVASEPSEADLGDC